VGVAVGVDGSEGGGSVGASVGVKAGGGSVGASVGVKVGGGVGVSVGGGVGVSVRMAVGVGVIPAVTGVVRINPQKLNDNSKTITNRKPFLERSIVLHLPFFTHSPI